MLAYRHYFHAGNFADVFKHALLVRLLLALTRKARPLCYIDTHAGVGRYDLTHPWAQQNAEFRDGIERLWSRTDLPESLAPYLAAVRAENAEGKLRYYPGSPRIARRLLRPEDRMVLTELNQSDWRELRQLFAADKRIAVERMDADQALKAYLPPKEWRGLVLIDSPFDRAGEFRRTVASLVWACERWATGVYALWYPLMDPATMRAFDRNVAASGVRKVLQLEIALHPGGGTQTLRGCGLLVVNPPFEFDTGAPPMLDWLARALAPSGEGKYRARWLVPE